MSTIGKHRRVLISRNRRRLAATAGVASVAMLGTAFSSSPASASYEAPTPGTSTGQSTTAGQALRTTAVATTAVAPVAQTPVVHLTKNHDTVSAAHTVTFTATEKTAAGVPISADPATLEVTTKHGWQAVTTKTLSANGSATFEFRPNYNHQYRAVFPAVTADGATVLNAVMTANVSVKVDFGSQIVAAAAKEKGKPYIFDTDGPNSFDCSGLVKYVFSEFGITLPHHADDMKNYGVRVSAKDAKPGDLVFVFDGSYAHHVAIYAGGGYWWEAPHTGSFVRRVKIWSTDIEFRRVS